MADPRFFTRAGPFPLAELAAISGAALPPGADPARAFADVAPLDAAGPDAVSFLDNPKYAAVFEASRAGACLVHPRLAGRAPAGMAVLAHEEPYRAYARVAQAFYPETAPRAGIAPGTHVDPTARLGPGVRVEPGAAIAAGAEIGAGTLIGANATVGPGVAVGPECRIGPGVTLQYCLVGARVIVHAGARIGQDGFGFAPGASGMVKVPQLGRVVIGDDVEIGANTTVDRGAGPDTVIGAGTKIDNLVQIAHNVRIGRSCVIVSQVGISGSTQVGDFVMIGGQAGLTGHLTIGKSARIAAQAGVMRDVPAGATVVGSPAYPVKEFWRQVATLEELARSGRRK